MKASPKYRAEQIRAVAERLVAKLGRPAQQQEITAACWKAGIFADDEEDWQHRATWPTVKAVLKVIGPDGVAYWDKVVAPDGVTVGWKPTPLFDLDEYRATIDADLRSTASDFQAIKNKIRYFERHYEERYVPPSDLDFSLNDEEAEDVDALPSGAEPA